VDVGIDIVGALIAIAIVLAVTGRRSSGRLLAGPRLAPWLTPAIHVGMKSDDRERGPTGKPRFAAHLVRGDPAFDAHVNSGAPCTASLYHLDHA